VALACIREGSVRKGSTAARGLEKDQGGERQRIGERDRDYISCNSINKSQEQFRRDAPKAVLPSNRRKMLAPPFRVLGPTNIKVFLMFVGTTSGIEIPLVEKTPGPENDIPLFKALGRT
jgi:hypothetical protein